MLLPVSVFIDSFLRGLDSETISYYILQKGNFASGTILFSLIYNSREVELFSQNRNEKGEFSLIKPHKQERLAELEANSYIDRARKRDPDLWVIEIEINPNTQEKILKLLKDFKIE